VKFGSSTPAYHPFADGFNANEVGASLRKGDRKTAIRARQLNMTEAQYLRYLQACKESHEFSLEVSNFYSKPENAGFLY
jgi:hypothetical protein